MAAIVPLPPHPTKKIQADRLPRGTGPVLVKSEIVLNMEE